MAEAAALGRRAHAGTLLSISGGAALAVVPAAVLSIAAHTLDLASAGAVAVVLTVGTFAGQLVTAWLVESALSGLGARSLSVPRWLVGLALAAVVALAVAPTALPVLVVAIPVLQIALETGRSIGVAERRDGSEVVAAVAVGVGCASGVALGFLSWPWAIAPVAAGVGIATLVRARVRGPRVAVPASVRAWVSADVGLTGVVYPVLNSVILGALGPAAAFLFASVSTITGLIAIPLNFLRVRLLKSHSASDIALSSLAVVVALGAIAAAEAVGLFRLLFGSPLAAAWIALAVARAWRGASLATTLPFAALRRAGRVRILLGLRALCAAVTVALALAVLATGSVAAVFGSLLVGELLQAGVYAVARRRLLGAAR